MKHSEKIAPIAAALSALSAMACCLPLGIAAAAGTAGLGVVLEPMRPWLMGISIVLLALGFVQLYRSGRTCQRRNSASVIVFLLSAVLVVAVVVFPQMFASFLATIIP